MADDHGAIIAQAVALVTKLGVTSKETAVNKQLLLGAEKKKKMLNSKSGKAFNKAYIDNKVAYHKAVIAKQYTDKQVICYFQNSLINQWF
jgi:putative membrane protein